jgi:hypothetical protein
LEKIFPQHYNFIGGILSGQHTLLKKYSLLKDLGFHYLLMNFSKYFRIITLFVLKILLIFFWRWPIMYHYLAYGISWLIIFFITIWNGKINIIRCFLIYNSQLCYKIFQWPYDPIKTLWIIFIILHTYNGLWLYHPSFLMGFFMAFFYHLINKSLILNNKFWTPWIIKCLIHILLLIFFLFFFNNFFIMAGIWALVMDDMMALIFLMALMAMIIPKFGWIFDGFINIFLNLLQPLKSFTNKIVFHEKIIDYSHLLILLFLFFYLFSKDFVWVFNIIYTISIIILLYFIFISLFV